MANPDAFDPSMPMNERVEMAGMMDSYFARYVSVKEWLDGH